MATEIVHASEAPGAETGTQEGPFLLTVSEAAHVLRVGRDMAYALARSGQIPVIRIGRRFLVPRESLIRWIEAGGRSRPVGDP